MMERDIILKNFQKMMFVVIKLREIGLWEKKCLRGKDSEKNINCG